MQDVWKLHIQRYQIQLADGDSAGQGLPRVEDIQVLHQVHQMRG